MPAVTPQSCATVTADTPPKSRQLSGCGAPIASTRDMDNVTIEVKKQVEILVSAMNCLFEMDPKNAWYLIVEAQKRVLFRQMDAVTEKPRRVS